MGMKISGEEMLKVLQGLRQRSGMNDPQKSEQTPAGDKVEFSSELQQANRTTEIRTSSDPERAERVQELKQQIKDGTYQPDLREVASSLLSYLSKMRS